MAEIRLKPDTTDRQRQRCRSWPLGWSLRATV